MMKNEYNYSNNEEFIYQMTNDKLKQNLFAIL